jgi:hypothetical protein
LVISRKESALASWQKSMDTNWDPAGETLGVSFGLVLDHQLGEQRTGNLLKKLTEQTGASYHGIALLLEVHVCWLAP